MEVLVADTDTAEVEHIAISIDNRLPGNVATAIAIINRGGSSGGGGAKRKTRGKTAKTPAIIGMIAPAIVVAVTPGGSRRCCSGETRGKGYGDKTS